MNLDTVQEDLFFLTENIVRPVEHMVMLRPTIEMALLRLGHQQQEVLLALDEYYKRRRTVH